MLQGLRHERIASHRLMFALATFDYRLHDSGEYSVNDRRIALIELLADS